jgi:hypothetical protein
MRLKRPNTATLACTVVSLVVLSAFAAAPAFALPEGRVYEMVSPVYKGSYSASAVKAVAPDGESLVFESTGVFAGLPWDQVENLYLARRTAAGWSTTPLGPPFGGTGDFSTNLEYALGGGLPGPNQGTAYDPTEAQFLLHRIGAPDTAEYWEVVGGTALESFDKRLPGAVEKGASGDLCHVVVGSASRALSPEAENTVGQIYDLSRGCGGESPSVGLVGVRNRLGPHHEPAVINPSCGVELGVNGVTDGPPVQQATFNGVSADGNELFFTTFVSGGDCFKGSRQLFVRVGGGRTLEVSRPFVSSQPFGGCVGEGVAGEVPCGGASVRADAYFKGASEDGSRVFFTTSAALVGEDKDTGEDLYMASIGCPEGEVECEASARRVTSLVQVSHDLNPGEPAEVQGVLRVASDGSHVYFVAHGVLEEGANAEGQTPVRGGENLYVYERDARYPTGRVAFVADLCSGPGASGEVEDLRCPASLTTDVKFGINDTELWAGRLEETQSTPDGGFLVFTSYGQLVRGDTDNAQDVYRYDAVNGVLDRVSSGEAGHDANGNRDDGKEGNADARLNAITGGGVNTGAVNFQDREMAKRAISEDGSRVVFSSSAPLSEQAINGHADVYEWHKEPGRSEGRVSLISTGTSVVDDRGQTISASGRDIFFQTFQGLVPQDTEGDSDIYDARDVRAQGGFPVSAAGNEECSGDACQGPLTNPAPLLVPGSVPQAPEGNVAAPVSKPVVKRKKTKSKAKRKKGKASGRSGKARRTAGRSGR